jgi:hypothetical protein
MPCKPPSRNWPSPVRSQHCRLVRPGRRAAAKPGPGQRDPCVVPGRLPGPLRGRAARRLGRARLPEEECRRPLPRLSEGGDGGRRCCCARGGASCCRGCCGSTPSRVYPRWEHKRARGCTARGGTGAGRQVRDRRAASGGGGSVARGDRDPAPCLRPGCPGQLPRRPSRWRGGDGVPRRQRGLALAALPARARYGQAQHVT